MTGRTTPDSLPRGGRDPLSLPARLSHSVPSTLNLLISQDFSAAW